jgi:hypothetical protein
MNLDWILSPLTLYIVVAVALLACMVVFVSIQSQVCRLRRAAEESRHSMAGRIEQVERVVADIGKEKADAVDALPVPFVRPSLNLTRRTQALRMRRRGESAESIAAALCTPRNEIELLFKVYEMVEYRRQIQPPAIEPHPDCAVPKAER